MDIKKTVNFIKLKHLLESLSSSDSVEKWTDEHQKEFIRLVKRLGVEDLEFNVVNEVTRSEMEHHYRVFFNWGLMTEMKNSKKISLTCSGKELGAFSRKGMYFLNDSNYSNSFIIWRPEIHGRPVWEEDDENKYYWGCPEFFNELKYAINETNNPVSGLRSAFPKKSVHQVLQTPFMILVKQAVRIED